MKPILNQRMVYEGGFGTDVERQDIRTKYQYIIPVYQRKYSWLAEVQCARLWKDIVNMVKQHKQHHFVGFIVSVSKIFLDGCSETIDYRWSATYDYWKAKIKSNPPRHPLTQADVGRNRCEVKIDRKQKKYKSLFARLDFETKENTRRSCISEEYPLHLPCNSKYDKIWQLNPILQ